jgi:hypothetical protein
VRVATLDTRSGRTGSARQWIEIPDTAKGDFALSSVFLSELATGAQKVTISPDRIFKRTSGLRFQAQIYNATRTQTPDLTLELRLSSNGQTIIATPPSSISTQNVSDPAHIPVTGEFPLSGFTPGRYLLSVTVTDRRAQRSATQQVEFTVE